MAANDWCIRDVQAWAISHPIDQAHSVQLGVGRMRKRDAVLVRVRTQGGLIGWGESHHGRAHTSMAHFINHALSPMVVGMDAGDVVGVWQHIYRSQLASHGIGAGCAIAMSGVDMALWDIRAKAAGWPLWRLLGGSDKPIAAYAGGLSLGWQPSQALVEEAQSHVAAGWRTLKLRLGDTVPRDLARVTAVRKALADDIILLADANTAYTLEQAREVIPALDALGVRWLEEPFPAHDWRSYALARAFGRIAFAAGENHYTRFEFSRLLEERAVSIVQPDLSKTGGITEVLRISALASTHRLALHPHTSMTGLNMAATLHVLAAVDMPGYFEADVSRVNPMRDGLSDAPFGVAADGTVRAPQGHGIGIAVDEAFIAAHPPIEGPAYA